MREWLLWVPLLPVAGFLALVMGRRLPRRAVAAIGVGSVGGAMAVAIALAADFLTRPPSDHAWGQVLWSWMQVGGLAPRIGLYLDPLSLVMVLVVTVVGFFIHLYSAEFMAGEEGYGRFFACMNLFVGSMLILVLADNLLLLYLGWEGVGLCSYLLIGFWYKDAANGRAAMKAFIVTRVGDAALAVGLLLVFAALGTLDIQDVNLLAGAHWPTGSAWATAAAALLLAGAVGKSAQLPLQTWLPDAMAGPTPVSALIHAATMVTAGVYLIARMHAVFELAPAVQALLAAIGAVTLLLAGFSAACQRDIKRVLAYSTISQVGYMFLALGAGAWSAAIFHFMTHACFKSLLFLSAGAVILALDQEHDLFRMGGLRRRMPLAFWTFLVGAASLSALPLVTAGFYSKDLILGQVYSGPAGGRWLWAAGWAGALLTSVYAFRVVFLAFFGPTRRAPARRTGAAMAVPLVVLAGLSLAAGLVELPRWLGHWTAFSEFMRPVLPAGGARDLPAASEGMLTVASAAASLGGIALAYLLFLRRRDLAERLATAPAGAALRRLWSAGWGFDWLYDRLLVRPFLLAARANQGDFVDLLYRGLAAAGDISHRLLRATQTGRVRWYAAGLAAGAVLILAMVVLR